MLLWALELPNKHISKPELEETLGMLTTHTNTEQCEFEGIASKTNK